MLCDAFSSVASRKASTVSGFTFTWTCTTSILDTSHSVRATLLSHFWRRIWPLVRQVRRRTLDWYCETSRYLAQEMPRTLSPNQKRRHWRPDLAPVGPQLTPTAVECRSNSEIIHTIVSCHIPARRNAQHQAREPLHSWALCPGNASSEYDANRWTVLGRADGDSRKQSYHG